MSDLTVWVHSNPLVPVLAGPLSTIVASTVAGFIAVRLAYWQRNIGTASVRAAEDRLALDLFDKRYELMSSILEGLNSLRKNEPMPIEMQKKLQEAIDRSRYLFDQEIADFLHASVTAQLLIWKLERDPVELRETERQKMVAAREKLRNFNEDIAKLIDPYLKFGHIKPRQHQGL